MPRIAWEITSDALAARVAEVIRAERLVLLKSMSIPRDLDWDEAGQRGFVDGHFARVIARWREAPSIPPRVDSINFRP